MERMQLSKEFLNFISVVIASLSSAAVLISLGVVVGKLTPTQCLAMTILETPIVCLCVHLGYEVFGAADTGIYFGSTQNINLIFMKINSIKKYYRFNFLKKYNHLIIRKPTNILYVKTTFSYISKTHRMFFKRFRVLEMQENCKKTIVFALINCTFF